jgi:hypothetical protein
MDYILVEREQFDSRLNPGHQSWRLTFYCLADGTFWEMTVDTTFKNYRKRGWDHVVADPRPWAVYSDLARTTRVSRTGIPIVTADSQACVEYRFDSRDQALLVMEADYRERHPDATTFRELFE